VSAGCTDTPHDALYLGATVDSAIESLNASANTVTLAGSAMELYGGVGFGFVLRFGAVNRNARANCLAFDDVDVLDVFCVSVVNNSCNSTMDQVGMIIAAATATLKSCIFRANTFDFFIGSRSDCNVTFTRCAFDFDMRTAAVAESVVWVTTACLSEAVETSFVDCRTRTPMPTQTVVAAPSARLPITAIVGGCIAGVVLIIAAIVLCTCCRRRPRHQFEQHPVEMALGASDLELASALNGYRARS
jgi:hypothetical protein